MNKSNCSKILVVLVTVGFLFFSGNSEAAENRWIDDTASEALGQIIRDEIRDRIYLTDLTNLNLVIIDSITEEVVKKLPLPGTAWDMDISKNGTWLVVATGGGVTRIDLNRLRGRNLRISKQVEGDIISVAFDYNESIFIATKTMGSRGLIYLLSPNGRRVIKQFGVGQNLDRMVYSALLKTDATGTILYVAEKGLSPASLYKIDVTRRRKPVFLGEDEHGDLGGNLRDFVISPKYNEVYLACGAPYGIQVVDAETLRRIDLLTTGPYPGGVDVSRYGNRIYGIPTSTYNNHLDKFDANPKDRRLIQSYDLLSEVRNAAPQPRGLAVDRFAEKAFIIHGNSHPSYRQMKVQVVDVGE